MSEDPVTKAMREVASELGIDVSGPVRRNKMHAGEYPIIDIRATEDPKRFVMPDETHWEKPGPIPYNGMDIIGYSLQTFIDDMDLASGIDRLKGPFSFNW